MNKSRIRETTTEVIVGAFLFMVLLALGFFTIVLSRENLFTPTYRLEIVFDNIQGLGDGDNVFVRGVDIGKIKEIRIEQDGVHVIASLEQALQLYDDYAIEILPSSVLGGRYLSVKEGSRDRPLLEDQSRVHGISPVDLIDEATRTIQAIRTALEKGGILNNLETVMAQIKEVTTKLSQGEGTIGKLLMDDKVYGDIEKITENLKVVSEDLAQGKGTLGKLLADDKVYADIEKITENLKTVSEGLAQGKGTIGKLLAEDKVYADIEKITENLKVVSENLSHGKGTMGKILADDELYNQLKVLLTEARAAIDDIRESMPITTFSSIFFGAL